MFKNIILKALLALSFFILISSTLSAQWGAPLYSLSAAPDSGYVIITQPYYGQKGTPSYMPVGVFMNRYSGGSGFTEANTFYIDPNGNNTTGLKGRQDKPFQTPWGIASILDSSRTLVQINPGVYSASNDVTILSDYQYWRDSTTIFAYNARIIQDDIDNTIRPGIGDYVDGNTNASQPRYLYMRGGQYVFNRGSAALILGGIRIVNPNTFADIDIESLEVRNGRTFGAFLNANGRMSIGKIDIDGGIIGGVGDQNDATGAIVPVTSRNSETRIQQAFAGGAVDNNGLIRYQSATKDSSSNILISVAQVTAPPNGVKPFLVNNSGGGMEKTNLKIEIGGAYNWDNSSNPPREGYFEGSANNLATALDFGLNIDSSTISVRMNSISIVNGPFIGSYNTSSVDTIRNSVIIFEFDQVTVDTGTFAIVEDMRLENNSTLIFRCNNCVNLKSPWFSFFDIEVDSTSQILIEGNWRTLAAKPVIQSRVSRVFLRGLFSNDGTVPALDSDVPGTNIYVYSAFNENTISADSDVNTIRLPEYGGGGGGDGNGIISALPLGNVTINAAQNDFTITDLDVLNFATDAAGSAKSTLRLTRSGAAPVRISHENPASATDAGELILDWDGNTQLKGGDGQDVVIEAETAPVQIIGDSLRITNLPSQPEHDNYMYDLKANSTGYVVPIVRSYGYMAFSNEIENITTTGGTTFDIITNATNDLFASILQTGDFTVQGDSIIILRDGFVSIDASVSMVIAAGALGRVKLLLNGTAQTGGAQISDSASADAKCFAFPSMLQVNTGDVIKIGYEAVTAGNISVNAGAIKIKYE